jgi:uncharacterized protein YcbK (DUF882 family)
LDRLSVRFKRFLVSSAFALPVAASVFLVSCTSTGSNLDVTSAGLQPALTGPSTSGQPQTSAVPVASFDQSTPAAADQGAANPGTAPTVATSPELQAATPGAAAVAAAPEASQLDKNSKLVATAAAAASENSAKTNDEPAAAVDLASTPAVVADPVKPAAEGSAADNSEVKVATTAEAAAPTPDTGTSNVAEPAAQKGPVLTSTPPPQQVLTAAELVALAPAKKKTLFGTLFGSNEKSASNVEPKASEAASETTQLALAAPSPQIKKAKIAVEPVLQPAKLDLSKLEEPQPNAPAADNGELPGVRKGALFEIKRRDSIQDDTDVDIGETDSGPVLLASAAGLARLAPNGLKVQRESVDVACLKPQLVKILKKIESHYRSPVVVTSGYRSPGYNRRVRGAKNSLHMFCAAADVQVVGVGKWELARFARSMSGRGGVGTYCHTDSVHIDVGPDRDWNWRCSRRK